MSKHVVIALLILALAIIVLIITKDRVDLNLLVHKVDDVRASFVYFGWMAIGVLIGALLK